MARALVAGSLTPPFSKNRKKNWHRCRCGPPSNNGRDASPEIRTVVEGVTELLRLFSSKKPRDSIERNRGQMHSVRSIDDLLEVIQDDYQQAYFLTGNFTPEIYTEDCLFEDPTIKFRGRDKYAQNLDLLVPFFDNPSLELEQIQKDFSNGTNLILASWNLRTYLKLPWRPFISIKGQTTYDVDKEYKITKHSERWNIPAIMAIGQIFGFNSREIDV